MYIKSYDAIPIWAYGIDKESFSDIENLERIDSRYPVDEVDLLNNLDFLFENLGD